VDYHFRSRFCATLLCKTLSITTEQALMLLATNAIFCLVGEQRKRKGQPNARGVATLNDKRLLKLKIGAADCLGP
jgi:hypothetical protein